MADYGDYRTAHTARRPKKKMRKGAAKNAVAAVRSPFPNPLQNVNKARPAPAIRPVQGPLYTKGTTRQTTGGFTKSTPPPQTGTPSRPRGGGLKRRTSY